MQTFLPYPDFQKSAEVLDYRRLGKQRVEAFQILKTIQSGSKAWANHPAVRMWRGYEDALAIYMNRMISEWIGRGFNNTMVLQEPAGHVILPPWLGDERFHASHRAALLAKEFAWYGRFGWTETPVIEYVWPTSK